MTFYLGPGIAFVSGTLYRFEHPAIARVITGKCQKQAFFTGQWLTPFPIQLAIVENARSNVPARVLEREKAGIGAADVIERGGQDLHNANRAHRAGCFR